MGLFCSSLQNDTTDHHNPWKKQGSSNSNAQNNQHTNSEYKASKIYQQLETMGYDLVSCRLASERHSSVDAAVQYIKRIQHDNNPSPARPSARPSAPQSYFSETKSDSIVVDIESLPCSHVPLIPVAREFLECSICLEEINSYRSSRRLSCCHEFHDNCIRDWLKRSNDCPICRTTQ